MTSTPQQQEQNRRNFIWLFMSLFFLGIFFLGSTYLFVVTQKVGTTSEPVNNQTAATQTEIHAINARLNTVSQKDLQKDFTQVNQELKNL